MKKYIFTIVILTLFSLYSKAQIYEKGLLVQRITTAERLLLPAGTAEGELFYDTDTDTLWTYNGSSWSEQITADENGYVGIGVYDPQENLHIKRASSKASIKLTGTSGNINLEDIDAPLNTKVFAIQSSSGEFNFGARNDSYTWKKTRFKINSTGIGMNTSYPQRDLHVLGRFRVETTTDEPFEIDRNSNVTAESAIRFNTNNTNKWFFGMDNNSKDDLLISSYVATDDLAIQTGLGKVGIGTETPDEKVEIEFGTVNQDIEFGVGTTDTDVTFMTLRSPNGTKYYLTVNDAGFFTASTTKP